MDNFEVTLNEFSSSQHSFIVAGRMEKSVSDYTGEHWYPIIEIIYLWDKHNTQKIWLWTNDKDSFQMLNMFAEYDLFDIEKLKYLVRGELGL